MPIRRVSPQEALDLVRDEGFVYVDVRSVPEFEAGHPEGAYNIPLAHAGAWGMEPNREFVDVVRRTFPPETKMVLGCRSGGRSLRAAEMLRHAGFEHVVDQRAGFDGAHGPFGGVAEPGWRPAGLPVSTVAEPGRSWDELKAGGDSPRDAGRP